MTEATGFVVLCVAALAVIAVDRYAARRDRNN